MERQKSIVGQFLLFERQMDYHSVAIQVISGTNMHIRIHMGYIHIRIRTHMG
jgi:hypothetical protein